MNFKKILNLSVLLFVCAFSVSIAHAEVATSTKEQKIEVLSPSGKGGETFFKRGEKIPYSYTLKKNSKKLVVSLYGGSKDETVYEAKKYDGWGTSTKVIAAKDTVKLEPGSYGLLICDYTENKNDPVCDSSDGVITITDDAALEVATSTPKEQKIEIKSPNGGEQFYKGESINYNYKLAKNTKNLLVELVDADKNTVEYSVKRYDGWGDNRKVISKEDTKKIPGGMYILRICDTSTRVPVCDVSNGRITIVDKLPTSQILTPVLTKVESKAADPNELFAGETAVVYGTNIDKYTQVYVVNGTQNKYFKTKYTQAGSISINTFKKGELGDGTYKIYAVNGNSISNALTVTYKNPKDDVSDEGNMNGSCLLVRNLSVGSTGDDVSYLQSFLQKKGFLGVFGGDKGYFGATTKAAVAAYQTSVGINPADGYVGPLMRAKINTECDEGAPKEYSLRITSPNGGQTLIDGQKTKIKWESNLPVDQEFELYLNFGQLSMGKFITKVKNSDKSYGWTVKSFDSLVSDEVTPPKTFYSDGTFRISIVCPHTDSDCMKPGNNETNYFDYSDSPFTIKSVNASTTDPDPSDGTYGDTQGNETRTEETRIINGAPTDACKNIPGDQAGIPSGYTNTGVKVSGNCKKVGAKDEFSEPVKEERKNQEQKIIKVCQVATRKTVNGEEKATWKDVKCEGDAYKNAIKKNKRMVDRPVEKGTPSSGEITYPVRIELESGMTHEFVKTIQEYLNSNGYTVNEITPEPGSKGYESDYFGEKTKQALIKFQKDKGISPAQGYFGPRTRAVMGL